MRSVVNFYNSQGIAGILPMTASDAGQKTTSRERSANPDYIITSLLDTEAVIYNIPAMPYEL